MPPPSPTTTTNAPKRHETDSTTRNVDDDVPFLQSFVVRLASILVAPQIIAKDVGNHATASSFALYWRSPVLIPNLRDVDVAEPDTTDPEEHDDDDDDDDPDDAEVAFVDATFAFRSSVSSSSSSPTPRADVRFGVFCLHRRGRRSSSSDEEARSSSSRRRPYVRGSYQQGSPLSFDDLRRHFEGVGFDLPRLDENGRAIDDDDDDDVPRNAPSSLAAWLGGALRRVGRGAPTGDRTADAFVDATTNHDDHDDRVRRRVLRLGVGPYRDLPTNELPLGVYSPERHRILPSPRGPLDMFLRNLDGDHGSAAAADDDDDDESSRSKSLGVLTSWWREATRSRSPDAGAAATRDAIDSNPEEESTERRDAAFSSRSGSVASSSSPTLRPALKRPRFGQTLVHQHSFVKRRPLRKKISVWKLT